MLLKLLPLIRRNRQKPEIIESYLSPTRSADMANKIRTEADRKATPRPVAPKGVCYTTGKGQKRSLERGTATNNKKNPGKRCKNGG